MLKFIIPRYKCIPQKFQEKMEYKGSFYMDLCADGKQYYVGIMEYQEDGVVYDFIDNDEFSHGEIHIRILLMIFLSSVILVKQLLRHLII